ncbi:hypothetical protein [Micromonospora pallida]|uniref:hypothetical protein n=1 Tax=Micromonospora pallida TaxID=145854 RepID=UPI000B87F827|nr:hypothetical protein [Micromonospora pallida]
MRTETDTDDATRATPDPVRRTGVGAGTIPRPVRGPGGVPPRDRPARLRPAPGGRHRASRRTAPAGGERERRRPTDRGRLLLVCGWATGLGAVALASAVRGLVLVLAGAAPQWYQPTVAALGLGGIVLGGVALHGRARPGLRWVALGLANLAVGVSAGLTASLP